LIEKHWLLIRYQFRNHLTIIETTLETNLEKKIVSKMTSNLVSIATNYFLSINLVFISCFFLVLCYLKFNFITLYAFIAEN